MTGEIPASQLPDPRNDPAGGGSVVDRPPPSPPDWMSGVQVPELLVTREIDRGQLAQNGDGGFVATAQRVIGLILVAVLVAVVVLIVASSLSRF